MVRKRSTAPTEDCFRAEFAPPYAGHDRPGHSRDDAQQGLAIADPDAWLDGCVQTRRRLAPTDQRRLFERDYRSGWNSYRTASEQTAAAGTAMASVGGSEASTPPAPALAWRPIQPPALQAPSARPTEWRHIVGLDPICLGSLETAIAASLGAPASRSRGTRCGGTPNAQSCRIRHRLRAC